MIRKAETTHFAMDRMLLFFLTLVLNMSQVLSMPGYFVFTAPSKLQMGHKETVCLLLTDFKEDVYVQIRLKNNGTILESIDHTFKDGKGHCLEFPIPKVDERQYNDPKDQIEVIGVGQETDDRFIGEKEVSLVSGRPAAVFIQTDKPLYKPGQLVRFRVLVIDEQFRPVDSPVTVELQNPLQVKLEKWNDKHSEYGLMDFDFQLSREPVMGTWTIVVTHKGIKTRTTFKVEEYVLPKFEVTVTPPSYLNPWTPLIEGKVCAKYTYGKPVKGKLRVDICLEHGYYYYRSPATDNNRACTQFIDEINGCQDFSVNSTLVGLPFNTYSVWSAKIRYNASIVEEGTGVVLYGSAETNSILTTEVNINFEDVGQYFKPGLPFSGKVVVKRPDSTAAPGEPIRLIARSYHPWMHFERNFTTDINGEFYFSLPAEAAKESFNLEASAIRYMHGATSFPENHIQVSSSRAYMYLKPWYSPSNSFIDISNIKDTVKCGESVPVEVTYSTPPGTIYKFHYQVMTRGNIVSTGSQENSFEGSEYFETEQDTEKLIRMTTPPPPPTTPTSPSTTESTNFTAEDYISEEISDVAGLRFKREANATRLARFRFNIPLSSAMAGGGKLLVFYIREDNEVVAANINFKAQDCMDNEVELDFAESPVHPGDPTTVVVTARPGSLCGVTVVDKSVLLLGGDNQLSLSQVIKFWNEIDPLRYVNTQVNYQESNLYCLDQIGIPEKYQDEVDERVLRLDSSWHDLPFRYQVDQVDALAAFMSLGLVTITNLNLMTRPCSISDRSYRRQYLMRGGSGPVAVAMSGPPGGRARGMASKENNDVIDTKKEKVRTYFPETWLWDIQKIGEDGQLVMTKSIPDTITEWVGNAVCTNIEDGMGVSNTQRVTAFKPFFASYTLPYSVIRGERIPLPVTVFNYMSDCLAIRVDLDVTKGEFDLDGESSVVLCVCGQESVTHRYIITPNTLGKVNITVDAKSVTDAGFCSNSLTMSSEGIGARDIVTRPLLVEPEGIPEEYTISYFVCPSQKDDGDQTTIQSFDMLLPDDVILDSARGYITVIGDLMGSALNNLDSLVKMPYGCGEQNMASFTPNIYVRQYLDSTNRLTPEISTKTVNYMKSGYQRQLRYRHKDGSYSAFGSRDDSTSGSSWLTAFVVKSLAQARSYIYIDQEDFDKSISFFNSTQDNTTGCFPKIGQTSAYLKGGLEGQANSSLTAYILIALLEADIASEDPVVKGAVRCIVNDEFSDIYTTALAAYALTLYNEALPFRHELLQRLRDTVIEEDGEQHWERKDKPSKPETRRWWWYYPAKSAEVEMTAYALMALIGGDKDSAILTGQPIVQWLSRQRNAYGGFSSTQDTVVALQALADYGSLVYTDGLDMSITITEDGNDLVTVELTDTNSLIPKKQFIDNLPTELKITGTGSGCALVQANARYNIKGETPKDPAFNLYHKLFQSVVEPKSCDRQRMQICVEFTVPAQVSNMAILEVKMVTGWVPEENSLKDLVAQPKWGIERYEIDNNIVNFYFSQISAQKSCVYFELIKELEVNNTQPGRIHIYDYYETDYSVMSPYEIEPQCNSFIWRPIFFDDLPFARTVVSVPEVETANETEVAESLTNTATPCPHCPAKMVDNLEELVCKSDVVYKIQAGRKGGYPLKLKANFRPSINKKVMEKFSNFTLPTGCDCPILSEYTKVFVFGPSGIFDAGSEMLNLDESTAVLRLTKGMDKDVRSIVSGDNCLKKK